MRDSYADSCADITGEGDGLVGDVGDFDRNARIKRDVVKSGGKGAKSIISSNNIFTRVELDSIYRIVRTGKREDLVELIDCLVKYEPRDRKSARDHQNSGQVDKTYGNLVNLNLNSYLEQISPFVHTSPDVRLIRPNFLSHECENCFLRYISRNAHSVVPNVRLDMCSRKER